MRSGSWLALAAAILAPACADDGGKQRYDDPVRFCEDLTATWAARQVECAGFTDAAARWALERLVPCERIAAGIEAGRIRYDEAKAEACVAAFGDATCEEIAWEDGPPRECAEAVTGLVAAGSPCTLDIDVECADGWCDFTEGCFLPGVCRANRQVGQSCTGQAERCAPGLTCNGVCAVPTVLGAGGNCGQAGTRCGPGLFCDWDETTLTCQPRRGAGACAYDEQCVAGLHCAADACVPYTATGGTCTPGDEACRTGASCAAPGTCTAWPGLGQACGGGGEEWVMCLEGWCPEDLVAAPTCQPDLAPGATCDPSGPNPCGPGYGCRPGELPVCAPFYCGQLKG